MFHVVVTDVLYVLVAKKSRNGNREGKKVPIVIVVATMRLSIFQKGKKGRAYVCRSTARRLTRDRPTREPKRQHRVVNAQQGRSLQTLQLSCCLMKLLHLAAGLPPPLCPPSASRSSQPAASRRGGGSTNNSSGLLSLLALTTLDTGQGRGHTMIPFFLLFPVQLKETVRAAEPL